jgi:hypothetical protein
VGTIGRISYPSQGRIGKLSELFALLAGSVDAALPVKFVSTLAQLNGVGMTAAVPAGTLAVLTADDSGLAAGAQFALNPDGKWRLSGTCTALNVDTFVTAITSLVNVRVLRGAQAWNAVTSSLLVFTSATGAYSAITVAKTIHGTGTVGGGIAVAATHTVAVAFPVGSFAAEPKNIIVTAASTRLTCAAVSRTKDAFSLQLSNFSNGAAPSGIKYYWTAIA